MAIHITAMNPEHVHFDDIPKEDLSRERGILEEKAKADGSPTTSSRRSSRASSRSGRRSSSCSTSSTFNQERYEGKTIEDCAPRVAAKTGENVRIARFARFEVGQE